MKTMTAFLAILVVISMPPLSGAHGQSGDPGSGNGVRLDVQIDWATAGVRRGDPPGMLANIILLPDHMIITDRGVSIEQNDLTQGCGDRIKADRLKAGRDPGARPTDEEIAIIMECRHRSVLMALSGNSTHAVFLPYTPGPRKCTEMALTNGQYRICASLLGRDGDNFHLEYERDTNTKGGLLVNRTRFDLTLGRVSANPGSYVAGCRVRTIAGFISNPDRPENLAPLDHVKIERCGRS
jgi:hypothetical protein